MESLCFSANKESEDAYDVSTSLTGLSSMSRTSVIDQSTDRLSLSSRTGFFTLV